MLTSATGAFGQAPPAVPGSAEPGRVDEQFQPGLPEPLSDPDAAPTEAPDIDAPAGADEVTFMLNGISLEGSTVFSNADLMAIADQYVGTEVSLLTIYEIATQVTALYRDAGYVLSRAVVPPQEINNGTVVLQAVEGYVDQVNIEGDIGGDISILESYAESIKADRPLRSETLERYLLLASDLAGAEANGVLQASANVPGASDLTIVMEHDYFDGFASIDNRSSRFVGEWIGTAGVGLNSVAGLYEEFNLTGAVSVDWSELFYGEAAATLPIGGEGTEISISSSYSFSEPGASLKPFDVDSRSFRNSISVTHPFIRSRRENLFASGGIEWNDFQSEAANVMFSDDSLRVVRLSGQYDFVDDLLGVNVVAAEISQGIPVLGASDSDDPNLSRPEGSGTFTSLKIDASRLQQLAPGLNLFVAASAQVANTALLASEEFGVGGAEFGRGYDGSEITGDHGLAAKFELQYGENLSPDDDIGMYLNSYQIYTFWDTGIVWNISQAEGAAPGPNDTLNSVGAGVRLNVLDNFAVNLELAHRIGRDSSIENVAIPDTRGYLSILTRF